MRDVDQRKHGRATQKIWVRTRTAGERMAPGPRRRQWEWAATTADERRIAALSERFNRSRRRDLGPAITVVTGLLGLVFVAIGIAVVVVLAGRSGAVIEIEQTAGRTVRLLAERANADGALWALYAGMFALSAWLLYRFRRALYVVWIVILVGLFALGVAGSMAIAHQFAERITDNDRPADPLGVEDLEKGVEVLSDKAQQSLMNVESTLDGSRRRRSGAGAGTTSPDPPEQTEAEDVSTAAEPHPGTRRPQP